MKSLQKKIPESSIKNRREHKEETKNRISKSMRNYHHGEKEKQKEILDLVNKISKNINKSHKMDKILEKLNKAIDSLKWFKIIYFMKKNKNTKWS